MALWLFRRRSKRSRSGAALSDADNAPPRSAAGGTVARTVSKRKQRAEPSKPAERRYSFSPNRQESIHVDRHDQLAPGGASRDGRTAEANAQDPAWDRIPTLHPERGSNHLMRRKSSKRRREDHNREAEIKAMSSFVPARPGSAVWPGEHATKHGNKRAKTMGAGGVWGNPASDISLPFPGSIRSSFSSESDFVSYKVSALDSLAPRPTLRYAQGSRLLPSRASVPTRSSSQKRALAGREPIPEETLKAHKRVDDLADDFDAGELRELMERDARRRERQRQHEREKMERRLARRAEKQRKEEAEARKTGTPPPENLERGVMGRELVGLGIDPPSTVVTSSKPRTSPEPMSGVEEEESEKPRQVFPNQPLESFHRTNTAPRDAEVPSSTEEPLRPPYESEKPLSALPPSFRLDGALKSINSRSKSTLDSDREKAASAIDDDSATRKGSVASSKTNRLSFTTFLRWGMRSRRNSGGPSSFSNTSREEMAAAAAAAAQAQAQTQAQALTTLRGEDDDVPAPLPATPNYMASKPGSGVPKRTRSRFREDLPELPLSPPDSRLQSPEAEPPLPVVTEHMSLKMKPAQMHPVSDDTPTWARRPIEIPHQPAISRENIHGTHSAEQQLSMSMASIDSEGSWLSGRVGSQRTSALRESRARARLREREFSTGLPNNSTQDGLDIAEDDYMSRLSPDPDTMTANTRLSGEGRPSSDDGVLMEESDVRWGAVGAHPQLIQTRRHDRDTFHSHKGLLSIDTGDEENMASPVSPVSPTSPTSPTSPGFEGEADLRRARSVRVGSDHVRNFSPRTAKLLEIGPRTPMNGREKTNGGQFYM